MTSSALLLALLAWLIVFAWCCTDGVRLLRKSPADAPLLLLLTLGALILRLLVPWGPLDQAEPDRARLLWELCSPVRLDYSSIKALVGPLLFVGVDPAHVYRIVAMFIGTSTVVATYLCARALGLDRALATLAGCIVLAWPSHIRYSGTLGLNVLGGTLWAGAFAATAATALNKRWRTVLLAALIVLLVYTREEFRALVPFLGFVLLTREWTWSQRIQLVVLVLIGVVPYLRRLPVQEHPMLRPLPWFDTLFDSPTVTPNWWCYLGVVGLIAGRLRWQYKGMLITVTAALFTLYSFFGGEYNPLFGVWRYYIAFLPMLAIGGAALIAWLPSWKSLSPAWVLAVLTVVSVAHFWHPLTRETDIQAQFQYLLQTSGKMAQEYKTILIVGKATGEMGASTPAADNQASPIGMATRLVPPVVQECSALHVDKCAGVTEEFLSPAHWHYKKGPQAKVVSFGLLNQPCVTQIDRDHAAVFVGLNQSAPDLVELREHYRFEPIEERMVPAATLVSNLNSQCEAIDFSKHPGTTVSDNFPDCLIRMGWYRLVPKPPI